MLRAKVFYLIRRRDVELAETFARRCPDVTTVPELNRFFHQILSQHETETHQTRYYLDDGMNFDVWADTFQTYVLPTLLELRFPSDTSPQPLPYNDYAHRIRPTS